MQDVQRLLEIVDLLKTTSDAPNGVGNKLSQKVEVAGTLVGAIEYELFEVFRT